MTDYLAQIRRVLRSVGRRWTWLTILRCSARAALSASIVLLAAWLAHAVWPPASLTPAVRLAMAGPVLGALLVVVVRALWPLARRPSDAQVARLIEERCPQLEDRLVTAVECAAPDTPTHATALADLLYRDAARRTTEIELDRTISRRSLVRAAALAGASALGLAAILVIVAPLMRDDLLVLRGAVAGPAPARYASRPKTLARPASVTSIDVRYEYPAALHLPARTEENTGDVYAPAGTRVQLRIHTDKPVRDGGLVIKGGARTPLSVENERLLGANLTITEDASYRVALTDATGAENPGDTEYFIRVLADVPPGVRIVEPASDREVTPLEEVTIAARAEDDHGVKGFDLVYSVGGGAETVVPFATSADGTAVDGKRTLYLEDLRVRPGDMITYYARARDGAAGARSSEARSDLFFLQVTPFEREFMPPQSSQAQSGGVAAPNRSLDDLIKAQKDILVATWRLDRRARKSRGAGSEDDVRTIARAQGDLKTRAAGMAGLSFARGGAVGKGGAGEADEAMANAVAAMGRAQQSLDAAKTSDALPHETRALNELMKAQASNQQFQMKQAAGARGAGDTGNADLTSLFDQELKRQQRTNYETPRAEKPPEQQKQDETLERLRKLAERQDELTRRQQDLARDRAQLGEDEVKRQLERLTREQSDLRAEAEDLAQRTKGGQSAGGQAGGGRPQAADKGEAGKLRDASQAMGQAASELRDGKLQQASARGSEALEKLRSAEQQMAQGGPGTSSLGDLQMQARQAADAQRQIAREAAAGPTAPGGQGNQAALRPGDPTMRRLAGEKERLADQVERLGRGLKGAAAAPGLEGRQREAIGAVTRDLDRLQLPKQMRDEAQAMRTPGKGDVNRPPSAAGEQDLANTLGRLADRLAGAAGSRETQEASEQLGQARDARDRLAQIERRMSELQRQTSPGGADAQSERGSARGDGSKGSGTAVGTSGRATAPDGGAEMKRLQEEYARELQRAADQLNRLGREGLGRDGGGAGLTPKDARGLSPLSARGYNQDYSKWEALSREINAGLERAETVLTKKLRDQQARDRLLAPAPAPAPEEYRRLIEQYYASLARKDKR